MTTTTKKTYTIDATGKTVGRLATEIATILRGKDRTDFAPNMIPDVMVTVENAKLLSMRESKKDGVEYTRYSGYPGGLKKETLREVVQKKGHAEVLKRAVYGMLPGNKLRKQAMKLLIINE